jgi:perosamine synthetase
MSEIPLIEPVVGDEELENIKSVLESGYMTQGPYAEEFEELFTELTGADHAITATSCTTGMDLALEAVGVGPGDEVIVPDFTHPATANVVERRGATPVLVDVDRETYNIDTNAVADAVSADTGALLPVSWGGQPLDSKPLHSIAEEYNLPIVEDAACSAGAAYDGHPVGTQFDVSVFSFHPRKVLTTGEGGMITTDDEALEREMRSAKNFGTDPSGDHPGFRRADATNYRLSDILAAVGVAQMEKQPEITERRQEIAHRYTDMLQDTTGVTPPFVLEKATHNFQSYCVYIEAGDKTLRDELIDAMADEGIETQIGTHALHRTDAFADAKQVGSLENSAALADNLLTLPVAHTMTEEQQHRVVNTLEEKIEQLT